MRVFSNSIHPLCSVLQYSRAPETDPSFIRPLPVLEMTMEYLLSLINIPYPTPPSFLTQSGDQSPQAKLQALQQHGGGTRHLLALHSFLWDRMRAVRADLRMQHLFGPEGIEMHERMVSE